MGGVRFRQAAHSLRGCSLLVRRRAKWRLPRAALVDAALQEWRRLETGRWRLGVWRETQRLQSRGVQAGGNDRPSDRSASATELFGRNLGVEDSTLTRMFHSAAQSQPKWRRLVVCRIADLQSAPLET